MTFKTRNQCEEYVLMNISNGTLKKSSHTKRISGDAADIRAIFSKAVAVCLQVYV